MLTLHVLTASAFAVLQPKLGSALTVSVLSAENTIVASVLPWAPPAAAPPAPAVATAPQGGMRPMMVNVTRGGMMASTTVLNRGNGAGLISINRMAAGNSATAPPQNPPIRRCIF